jgi:hypothetical protein
MIRVLGLGLSGVLAVFAIGAMDSRQPGWIVIFAFIASGVGIVLDGIVMARGGRGSVVFAFVMAVLTGIIFVSGLGADVRGWLPWAVLAVGCAFLLLGGVQGYERHHGRAPYGPL